MSETSPAEMPAPPMPTVPCKDTLLVEYQAAQDSAQHHDNLLWSVTSVIWGGSLVLMGFTLGGLGDDAVRPVVTILSFLGIALTICVSIFSFQLNAVKRHKYARCRAIEAVLNMQQHTTTRWPVGLQRILYSILMLFFLIAWIAILLTAWHCCCH